MSLARRVLCSVVLIVVGSVGGVGIAGTVHAEPFTGFIGLPDCSGVDEASGPEGELIASLVYPHPSQPPAFLFDLRGKGGQATEDTRLLPRNYESVGDWSPYQGQPEVVFVRIALPPARPGGPPRVVLDSGWSGSVDMGVTIPLEVGDSLPVGRDAGIGLVISSGGRYSVNFGSVVRQYPQRDSDGSVTLAFAPLAEVNERLLPGGCTVSGHLRHPSQTSLGGIRGYNAWRLPDTGAPTGPDDFTAALTDGDPTTGFVGFIDLAKFRTDVATDVTVDATVNDLDLADGASLHDPDGRMYSGDEVVLWTDAATGPRAHPARAPRPEIAYRYAIQPVAHGTLAGIPACHGLNCLMEGNHLRDLDGNGSPESVDLDGIDPATGDVEFISPQADPAEGALPGLGLTWRSKLLVSTGAVAEPAPIALRRSTQVTSFDPTTPPLSAILPLDVGDDHVVPFASGDVDPDPAVIESSAYPIVYYSVPGRDIRAAIVRVGPTRHVRFTF